MKRLGGIYDQIWRYENLLAAFVKVRRGHGEKAAVVAFQRNLDENLREISDALRSGQPRFGDYHFFTVHDPKERQICAAAVRERVMHHAIVNLCGPWMERPLITDTFACRKGYGQFKALERARGFLRRHAFFLKMDVQKYFDSIRHAVMSELLARLFKDDRLLDLFAQLLASYCTEPGRGLPIGNLTSQYLANLYLSGFDHFAKESFRLPGYVRYMDDMLAFGEKSALLDFRRDAVAWLNEQRGLTLKQDGGYINRCAHGVEFLGFRAFPGKLRLNRRSKKRFKSKLDELDMLLASGQLDEAGYQRRSTALFSFVQHADTLAFRRNLLGAGHKAPTGLNGAAAGTTTRTTAAWRTGTTTVRATRTTTTGSGWLGSQHDGRRSQAPNVQSRILFPLSGTKTKHGAGLVAAGERPAPFFLARSALECARQRVFEATPLCSSPTTSNARRRRYGGRGCAEPQGGNGRARLPPSRRAGARTSRLTGRFALPAWAAENTALEHRATVWVAPSRRRLRRSGSAAFTERASTWQFATCQEARARRASRYFAASF